MLFLLAHKNRWSQRWYISIAVRFRTLWRGLEFEKATDRQVTPRRRMPRHWVGGGWGSQMAYFTFWKKLRILSKTLLKGSKNLIFFFAQVW
jgi:hypothetical protein